MNGLSVDRSYLVLKDLVIGGFKWPNEKLDLGLF